MKSSDFDFDLPQALIAQAPPPARTDARMMVLNRSVAEGVSHASVLELPRLLRSGDLLVLNDTRVFPARIFGEWEDTGGRIELLLVEERAPGTWEAMHRSTRKAREGLRLRLAEGQVRGEVLGRGEEGRILLRLRCDGDLMEILERHGVPPVPPYIGRGEEGEDRRVTEDRQRYQTVYAREVGAVAAPTAGLHFTEALLAELAAQGVGHTTITLHVGPGTFRPVKAEQLEEHVMESERYAVPAAAAVAIAACRARGGRVVAVGSTTVRTLETVAAKHAGEVVAGEGRSQLFIYPPYAFRVVDGMLTNFHLPRSSLLMMVSALAGRERVLAAYREAVDSRYRFYSYGDCMLIL